MNLTVSEKKHPQIDLLKLVQLILFGSLLLYFGKPLLVPLSFAMLISFLLYPVCKWLEKRGINRIIAILISVSMLVVLVGAVVYLLLTQLIAFAGYWDEIKTKFISSVHSASVYIADQFGITMLKQQQWLENLTEETSLKIIPFIKNTFMSLSVTLVLIILIPVFSALILINRHLFVRMLFNFFPRQGHRKILSMLRLTITAYYNFIRGMIIVYLTVGILNSIGFAIIGIPSPILFGFIASVLTFIPFVGIIISSLLPITLSWLLYNSVLYPLGVIVVLTIVQILEAYIIFPVAVSHRLHLNTLVTLIAILTGGIIWGAAGMILFVPFLAILKLIADHNPPLAFLSELLGKRQKKSKSGMQMRG